MVISESKLPAPVATNDRDALKFNPIREGQRAFDHLDRQSNIEERWEMPKILLVEDNEMNRDMLSRRLERKGLQVLLAIDGEQGVAIAHSESPDLILMDMSLPVMDGWAATRHLKSAPETCTIPIIALTAHAMADDRNRCLEAGCDDYDTKPIEFARLMEKIQMLLKPPTPVCSPD